MREFSHSAHCLVAPQAGASDPITVRVSVYLGDGLCLFIRRAYHRGLAVLDHAEIRMAHLPSSGDFHFIVRFVET